ncbi:hypothetical protein Tco_0246896 [Tanacetum coccineum]
MCGEVDLVNPEGHRLVPDVSKPLPLGRPPGQSEREYDISVAYGIFYWWFKRKEFYIIRQSAPSDRSIVMSHMWILSVVSLKTYERYGYTFLKEIVLCRADYNEHKISKAKFKNLHPNDFEDLYLLHLQGQLNHLSGDDKVHLFNAVNLWIRNIVIRKRVEDLQLGIEKIMRETEVHKFNDGTLKRILDKLDHMVKDFKFFEYNPGMEIRILSENDRRRSKEFMEVIERRLKIRRIFRSLESFVGTDIAKIARKQSKLDKHRHGNGRAHKEPEVFYKKVKKSAVVNPQSTLRDDPIVCLNKAMAFLTAVASSRFLRTQYKLREILLESKETKNYYSGWQSHCATSHGRQVSIVIWYWIIRVIATSSGGKCNAVQEGSWDQILDEQSNSHLYADLEVPVMVKLSKNNHFKQCCFSELRILILCSDCG